MSNKYILYFITLLTLLVTTPALAAPFITSDPQPGVVAHVIELPVEGIATQYPATPEGAVYIDMAAFTQGWHEGRVYSCDEWVVEDINTSNVSSLPECENVGAPIRFKVPNPNANSGFRVEQ